MPTLIEGRAEVVIDRTPEQILEWVLDLERYADADRKFRKIHEVTRDGNRGTARYSGQIRGVPTPTDRQEWELAPDYSRLEFRSSPGLRTRVLGGFEGWFECEPHDGSTRVVHVERMEIKGPLGPLVRRFAERWWREEIAGEVERMRDLIEADIPA